MPILIFHPSTVRESHIGLFLSINFFRAKHKNHENKTTVNYIWHLPNFYNFITPKEPNHIQVYQIFTLFFFFFFGSLSIQLFLKKLRPHLCTKPSMTWLAGFLCTVIVALVPPVTSASCDDLLAWVEPGTLVEREPGTLVERSLLAEAALLADTANAADVPTVGPLGMTAPDEEHSWESLSWRAEVELETVTKGPACSAVDVSGPASTDEMGVMDPTLGGWPSSWGCLISKSFKDSITASINICIWNRK